MSSKFVLTIPLVRWKLNDGEVKNRLKFLPIGNWLPLKVISITLDHLVE